MLQSELREPKTEWTFSGLSAEWNGRNDMNDFCEWIASELGTRKWCVAARTTQKLLQKYDIVITQKRYSELRKTWESSR